MDEAHIRALRMRTRCLFLLPRYRYRRNLRILNDVLGRTTFAGRYWITFGLLLGWARDGRPIPWDFRDADFAYAASDRDDFLSEGVQALQAAGFVLLPPWRSNAGVVGTHVFCKDKARFEFFEMSEEPEGYRYCMHAEIEGAWREITCWLPRHGLQEIDYLGRTWLKPDAHEEYLTCAYGDWRVRRPNYESSTDDHNIREIVPYEPPSEANPRK